MIRVHLKVDTARDFDTADGFAYDDTGFLDVKVSGSILATFAPGVWVSAELVVPVSPSSETGGSETGGNR